MTLAHQNTQLALLDAHVREHALPACAPRAAVGREEGPGDVHHRPDDQHIEGARAQEMDRRALQTWGELVSILSRGACLRCECAWLSF
jgi:hypothetical protein